MSGVPVIGISLPTAAGEILDDNFVHRDKVWRSGLPVVGVPAFSAFVKEQRAAYPDLFIEVRLNTVLQLIAVF